MEIWCFSLSIYLFIYLFNVPNLNSKILDTIVILGIFENSRSFLLIRNFFVVNF